MIPANAQAFLLLLFIGFQSTLATARDPAVLPSGTPWPFRQRQVGVAFNRNVSMEQGIAIGQNQGLELLHYYPLARIHVFRVSVGREEAFASVFRSLPQVEKATPNYIGQPLYAPYPYPNDPYYQDGSSNWHLNITQADRAWNEADTFVSTISKGTSNCVIAILDTGARLSHEDLASKIWTNAGEIPGNVFDDDGNGYVDDWRGYDFSDIDNDPSDSGAEDLGHGTSVSGTAAMATQNGFGGGAIGHECRLMILKVSSDGFTGMDLFAEWEAFAYSDLKGANVISTSFGSTPGFLTTQVNSTWSRGGMTTGAMGNSGINEQYSPADEPNAIGVAASDPSDIRLGFSTWGAWVDVAAPSGLSSIPYSTGDSDYTGFSGTSASSPQVAALAAILLDFGLTNVDVKNRIEQTCDDVNGDTELGWDPYLGWGRINAWKAFASLSPPLNPSALPGGASEEIDLSWSPPMSTAYPTDHFLVSRAEFPGGPYSLVNPTVGPVTAWTDPSANPGQPYWYTIKAVDARGLTTAASVTVSAAAPGTVWTLTVTPTITLTSTTSATLTPTATVSDTPTVSGTLTPSASFTPSFTISVTRTVSATRTPSRTYSPTRTYTPTRTVTPTATWSSTFSVSPTESDTRTVSPTDTPSPTETPTTTPTDTKTSSPSPTSSFSPTESQTATWTGTHTETATPTATLTGTWTSSHTPTWSPTSTWTGSTTATPSLTATPTASPTWTLTATPTTTPTSTFTPTSTDTLTPTSTDTGTPSPTGTDTPTLTDTRSASPSGTGTGSATGTSSSTPTPGDGEIVIALIAPNPVTTGSPILRMEVKGILDRITVKIFTPSGRRVGYWESSTLPQGIASYPLDLNLANGTYHFLVEIEAGGKVIARKAGTFFVLR